MAKRKKPRGPSDNNYNMLAVSIVVQAASDWRATKGKETGTLSGAAVSRVEIRQFFKSSWCAMLLSCTEIRPLELLACLEHEGVTATRRVSYDADMSCGLLYR